MKDLEQSKPLAPGATPPAAGRYVELAPAAIAASPFNHRKRFDKLDELAESMRSKGVVSPITVRPHPKPTGEITHELVVGERRWRAAKIAKLPLMPTMERDLTDKDVLEIQLIENVQRVDVHPLEEADGYKDLIDNHGYDVDRIATRTGKSTSYVYARMKLCALTPVPRKAFLDDKINAEIALLIARIPDAKLQAQATKDVLGEGDWQEYRRSGVEPASIDDPEDRGKREHLPLSVREARVHIRQRYMLRLDQAPFEVADTLLLPKAGACTTCSYRTGNQRELFSDVPSADVCTNPPCFEAKKKALWDRKASEASRAGGRVLNEREAKNVFDQHAPTRIKYDSAYVDPKDELPYDLNPGSKPKTWKQALGTLKPATVLALDGAGVTRELLDKKSAIATLEKAGKLKEIKREAKASRTPNKYDEERRKKEAENKIRHEVARLAFAELAGNAASDAPMMATIQFWRWLARSVLRMIDAEDCRNLCKRRELETKLGSGDAEKALGKIVAEATKTYELVALVVEFVSAFRAVGGLWAGRNYGENFTAACELFDVDLVALKAGVVKEKKAKAAARKPAARTAAKKGGKKS
jgi:ParB/RepB/Spo0J family partition protein